MMYTCHFGGLNSKSRQSHRQTTFIKAPSLSNTVTICSTHAAPSLAPLQYLSLDFIPFTVGPFFKPRNNLGVTHQVGRHRQYCHRREVRLDFGAEAPQVIFSLSYASNFPKTNTVNEGMREIPGNIAAWSTRQGCHHNRMRIVGVLWLANESDCLPCTVIFPKRR